MIVHKDILNALHMQKKFLKHHQFVSNLDYWNFTIDESYFPNVFWQFTLLCPVHNFQNFIIIV
jgi:hypothetical protein